MFSPLDFHASTHGWRLSAHAKQRAYDRGVRVDRILAAVDDPELSYPSGDLTILTRGRLAVLADLPSHTVVTLLLTGTEAWNDKDARAVFAPTA